jgi:hypothetical protein
MPLSNPVVIASIQALPSSPYNGTEFVGIIITSGISSYFRLTGSNLDRIVSIQWYPENPASVLTESRQLILVNSTEGTFMIRVVDNYLNKKDRGGRLSFRLDDGSTLHFPVKTYGPVSVGPLWQPSQEGLITG